MKIKEEKRTAWITLRVAPAEKENLILQAKVEELSMGDFLRQQLDRPKVRKTKAERQKVIQLARIGNNLNQISRWANTYKKNAEAAQILIGLIEIRELLKCL
ncbi:MAG: hypothetical protein BA863_11930 [Desulfovibrio sp. S3730MH75]|nr:MAG: hypothetical protein BA863_11930 [Desulfovibrio sp. S3730MH75]